MKKRPPSTERADIPTQVGEPLDDGPMFLGKDAIEAEAFIRSVKKKALVTGNYRDYEWTASYASTCFAGEALKWLVNLDPEVSGDWILLQRALLDKYAPSYIPSPR